MSTGLLLAGAFPPLDLGPLALVAPVPLLLRWRRSSGPRSAARDGFVSGVAFFGLLVSWTWWFGAVAYVPFTAVLAAYWAGAGALAGALARRRRLGPWTLASTWVLFEALRGRWPLGGFSWGEVGYAWHDVAAMRSVAAWGGVAAVSFVSVLAAGVVAAGLDGWREGGPKSSARHAVALGLVVLAVGLAHAFRPTLAEGPTLRVAVLQGNDLNRDLTPSEEAARYLPRSHFDLARRLQPPLDLVVFPESSLDEDPRRDPALASAIGATARRLDAAVLVNASPEVEGGRRLQNTNFLYGPDGRLQGRYVKQHLVPFGEYVPGRRFLEGRIQEIEQVPRDYAPGHGRRLFQVAGVPVGTVICFESAFTEIPRNYARDGAQVLVVSTNNRSFRRSANSAQHVAIGQMRAAETGRPVVHAAISGMSAFIDHRGHLQTRTELFERTALVRSVAAVTGTTPYVRFGDWVVALAALSILAAVARATISSRRRGLAAPGAGP